MSETITDVAVAVLLKSDGSFLLSSRPEGKPYAGYWEFPGGKVEAGESVQQALQRELLEELNIVITHAQPWFTYIMRYTHATVRLHAWRVRAWQGTLSGLEGQQFVFQKPHQLVTKLDVTPTLPGCVPIFNALQLPLHYAITAGDAHINGVYSLFNVLRNRLQAAPMLLQIREPRLPLVLLAELVAAVMAFKKSNNNPANGAHRLQVLLNVGSAESLEHAQEWAMDGVHLQSGFLLDGAQKLAAVRRNFALIGASVHNVEQLAVAGRIGCDFAVLGHVQATPSHPNVDGLGWLKFGAIAVGAPVPIYAIGGLGFADLEMAQGHGAHGLAMIRAAWR